MKVVWDTRALKDLRKLAKPNPSLATEAMEEMEKYAANPAKYPLRATFNFKLLQNHKHYARLRLHRLRLFVDRDGATLIVRGVVLRSDKTYD